MSKFAEYRNFVTVVEEGSLSAAARKLNSSVSAVSKRLTVLENRTRVQIIERSNRTLNVTTAGLAFYRECKAILAAVEEAEENLLLDKTGLSGKISITMSKVLCRYPLMQLLQNFSLQHPDIRFHTHVSDSIVDLHEQHLDFAFRLGELENNSRLVAIPMTDAKLIYCATPSYLIANGQPASFQQLVDHQLILLTPSNFPPRILSFIKQQKIPINEQISHSTNDIEVVYNAVRIGLCIGMLLDISIQKELQTGELVNVFPNNPFPAKKLFLIYKKSDKLSEKIKCFKEFVKSQIE